MDSKYNAYVVSTHPLGRKYRYDRHEQNLWNAVKQTGYSHLQYYWIGGKQDRRKWLYVPAVILLPTEKIYVDFLNKNGKKAKSVQAREEILKEMGVKYLHLHPSLSQQEMYLKIKTLIGR